MVPAEAGCHHGTTMHEDLATCLRKWRDRLDPADAGVARGGLRRAPGLRREEVAAEAGISVNYLMRLEQGRATTPSPSVVAGLVRALRLTPIESAHLHRLAGHANASACAATRHVTPSVRRLLDRFDDVPVLVLDPAWTVVAANRMAELLLADGLVGENVARAHFVGAGWVDRPQDDVERFEREVVNDLHLQLGRHPCDAALQALIAELGAASPRFAALWAAPPTDLPVTARKTFHHPAVGTITVDCDHLEVVGSDLRVVLWTAAPGSPDATALELLSVVGTQRFEA